MRASDAGLDAIVLRKGNLYQMNCINVHGMDVPIWHNREINKMHLIFNIVKLDILM